MLSENKIFLTVLKSAQKVDNYDLGHSGYNPSHVYALEEQIKRFYPKPHKFICLTDFKDLGCETIKLIYDLPGWWSKMELFRPGIYRKYKDATFIYFDLDTFINDYIFQLVDYPHIFSALADKTDRALMPGRLWSGIMAWRGDHTDIFQEFMKNPDFNMARSKQGGDQHFIGDFRPKFTPIKDIIPGCVGFNDLQKVDNPKIIYFHGEQKPWNVDHPLIDQSLYKR